MKNPSSKNNRKKSCVENIVSLGVVHRQGTLAHSTMPTPHQSSSELGPTSTSFLLFPRSGSNSIRPQISD